MSNVTEIGEEADDSSLFEPDDDDYVFIITADGSLKSILLPETVPFKAPKNITKVLKIFGLRDVSQLEENNTLH